MKKLKYNGTGLYDIYSDINLDVMKKSTDEYIIADLSDGKGKTIRLPSLLAIKKLRDVLTCIINKNKDYFKRVGE